MWLNMAMQSMHRKLCVHNESDEILLGRGRVLSLVSYHLPLFVTCWCFDRLPKPRSEANPDSPFPGLHQWD